jgi:hypothetical protein
MSTPEFMTDGLCAQTDPDTFHPDKGQPAATALMICRGCPVRAECLEYALAHDERFGIWGGTTAAERTRLRRHRDMPTAAERTRLDKRAQARRMHAAGRTKADIARALRLSGSTLNSYLAD